MRRRTFITLLGGAAVSTGVARAQQKTMRVIGWVGFEHGSARDGLLQGLHDLGYIEGQNVAMLDAFPQEGEVAFGPPVAELTRHKVDIIAAAGFGATAALHQAASSIPVVFVVADPVGSGFVASLARPGGNMTGLSLAVEERFCGKWLELLKEAAPRLSRVAYLWNPANHSSASSWKAMRELAPNLGVVLQSAELPDPKVIDKVLAAISSGRAEAIILDSDAVTGQALAGDRVIR
jgi:putative ABC transport system substrate-binding protein